MSGPLHVETDAWGVKTSVYAEGFKRTQDAEPIRDNLREVKKESRGWSRSRGSKLAMSVPNILAEAWMKEDGINFYRLSPKEQREWLRRKCLEKDCSDFLMEGRSDFRLHLSSAPVLQSKPPVLIV